jgi:hypothetical protein
MRFRLLHPNGYGFFPCFTTWQRRGINASRGVALLLSVSALGVFGLDWQTHSGYRCAPLPVPNQGQAGFLSLPAEATGVTFTNVLSREAGQTNMVLWNGSGVAAGDVDGDGWCDLLFCNLGGPNALYRNLGGWTFTNVAADAGVACPGQQSTGAVLADVDGDMDLDVLVSSIGGGVRLFINDGKGRFQETTATSGLATNTGSMTMGLADIDGNGTLDLYVANYRRDTFQDQPQMRFTIARIGGKTIITRINDQPATLPDLTNRYAIDDHGTVIEHGEPHVLYRNNGHGTFTPVPWTNGSFLDENGNPLTAAPGDWGLSAMFRDLNGDGAPDLYVCNDTHSLDRIWINFDQGRFRPLPRLALRQTSYSSMGVDFADLDRDGDDEIFVTDMLPRDHTNRHTQIAMLRAPVAPGVIDNRPDYQRNTLFLNRGDGTYAEIAQFSGVDATDWTWSPVFLDVDLDGYEDLLISTGHAWNLLDIDTRMRIDAVRYRKDLSRSEFYRLRDLYKPFECPNYAFRNDGHLRFENVSTAWGFASPQISQGLCLADLDNDGDLDVAVNCFNQRALLYRNLAMVPRLAVRLRGKAANTCGIGARIQVSGGPVPQSQQMVCGGRYVSGDDSLRTFAAGTLSSRLTIEVLWPSGFISTVTNALPNHIYEVSETGAAPPPRSPTPLNPPRPFFQDVSDQLAHVHHEEVFDDFARQPSLVKRLSQFGPGVSWFDLDGDGWEDLLVGSGRGGALGVLRHRDSGGFAPFPAATPSGPAPDDEATVLGCCLDSGTNTILVARSSYETGDTNGVLLYDFTPQGLRLRTSLPIPASSPGPLALADLNGDGAPELFIGGRLQPGRFPSPASSCLYSYQNGRFQLDEVNTGTLKEVGLVNGAVFTDLNSDGAPELVLACEWGSLRLFANHQGRIIPRNPRLVFPKAAASAPPRPVTLNEMTGWWQGLAAGDFDGDGRMDVVAANWGLNGRYQSYEGHTVRIYYGDLQDDGLVEFLDASYDSSLRKWVPCQRWIKVAALFPFTKQRITSFTQYSTMGIEEVLLEVFPQMNRLEASTFESVVLLNRGEYFEVHPLPLEAQLAPAFGVCAGDLDGDGMVDIFLSQNFFAVDPDTSRYDAGRGLWLRGDGHGGFQAVPGQSSGIRIYGEGRGAALGDYDADGRLDLAVAQNGAATKLYHNEQGRPGLRVRLTGPPSNPRAIGAQLRLGNGSNLGPTSEIQLGSGWLSQNSAVQTLSAAFAPTQLHICWPGGARTLSEVPAGAKEVTVDPSGNLKVLR